MLVPCQAEELLDAVDDDVNVIGGIMEEIMMQRDVLKQKLSKVWNQSFVWEEHYEPSNKRKTFTLVIRTPTEDTQMGGANGDESAPCNLKEAFGALDMLQILDSKMDTLADNIYNNFLR